MAKKGKINLKKELSKNQTLLLIVPSIDYNDIVVDMAKQLSGKNLCYVTLNKTYDSLIELFNKNKINTKKMMFIDAISKTLKKVPNKTANCYFVSSPASLTELSITITNLLNKKFDYLIFDSITSLSIYQKKEPVTKFVSSTINKIKETETKAIFYALKVKEQEELLKECCMFTDEVSELK